MATEAEITDKFWKALKDDRIVMLGIDGVEDGHTQPMTALTDDKDGGYIWFFTTRDNNLVQAIDKSHRAIATFASKGQDLFASIAGGLFRDDNREMIDRLWNPFVAAWYEGGKDDPNLQLVRFDPESAQIWLNETGMFAGIKILLGRDPKKDYKDKMAEVAL